MYLHQNIQVKIRENCGDKRITGENSFYYVALPDTCNIEIPPKLLRAELIKMHDNTEVLQELRFHLSVLDAQLGTLRSTVTIG